MFSSIQYILCGHKTWTQIYYSKMFNKFYEKTCPQIWKFGIIVVSLLSNQKEKNTMKKTFGTFYKVWLVLWLFMVIGYVKCIVHLCHTDFKAPYKAEILYGVGVCSGLGGVIGWFDIADVPEVTAVEVVK